LKKVLFVSYVFPPMAAVGGHRVLDFCRFLPRFGWTPIILTVKKGVNTSWDESLLDKAVDIKTYRSLSFEPLSRRSLSDGRKREYAAPLSEGGQREARKVTFPRMILRFIRYLLSVPDFAVLWIPFGVLKGLRVIRKEKIDVILSSSPPVSSHIIAATLSRLTGLPHLADFRDLWTLNHVYHENHYPGFVVRYDRRWERFVLRGADWVTTASPGFTVQMKDHDGGMLKSRVSTITNGFDYGEVNVDERFVSLDDKKMNFIYAGSLYGRFNPVFFLESLAAWIDGHKIDSRTLNVEFYGNRDYEYGDFLREIGLADIVNFHGFISKSELLPRLPGADCLLLFLGFDESCSNVIPAKLFEYLASGTPILALAPEGITADIIRRHQAGYIVSEPDKGRTVELLARIYEEWNRRGPRERKYRYIEEIDRATLTGRLAGLLDSIGKQDSKERLTRLRHKVP
jgi:glycosyltransferase involved in cell wall biosynthesis